MPLTPNQLLQNRYVVVSLLGEGGMGSVYRGFDRTLNRPVAIKERTPDPTAPFHVVAAMRAQFQREATILAGLSHPALPQIYDYFSFMGNEYVVMELIEGQSLDHIIEQFGAINEGAVRAWAVQILDALVYIHGKKIIHRDIKPANIILRPAEGKVVLVDFGLVKLIDPTNPHTVTTVHGLGTAAYAPVEQITAGLTTDERSDIYSLGATLYHLLTGCEPMDVTTRLMNPARQAAPRSINPRLSTVIERCIMLALEIRPEDRFPNARQMKAAMLATEPPAVTPLPPMQVQPPAPAPAAPFTPPPAPGSDDLLKSIQSAMNGKGGTTPAAPPKPSAPPAQKGTTDPDILKQINKLLGT